MGYNLAKKKHRGKKRTETEKDRGTDSIPFPLKSCGGQRIAAFECQFHFLARNTSIKELRPSGFHGKCPH